MGAELHSAVRQMNITHKGRMIDRVFREWVIAMLVGLCLSGATSVQSAESQNKTMYSPQTSKIDRFYVEEPKRNSGYETGPLHIIYRRRDGCCCNTAAAVEGDAPRSEDRS